jgi:hypothetical protein
MPVTENFTEEVSILVEGVWTPFLTQELTIKEARKERITGFSFKVFKTPEIPDAVWNALVLNASIKIYQKVGTTEDSFMGKITKRPKKFKGPVPSISISGLDETITATYRRFIDAWPKDGVRTVKEILTDAWTRYGPPGIDLNGIQDIPGKIDSIKNNLDQLYDFTEEMARRTGCDWRIRNSQLQFWDPKDIVFESALEQDINILDDSLDIGEDLPQVANVVFVPAKVRITDFEDKQLTRAGQAQYLLQYEPMNRQFEAAGGTVYLDEPPEVYLNDVLKTTAEDGGADAVNMDSVYNVENRFVRFNGAAVPQQDGLELKVKYTAEIPVIVRRTHTDSIELFGEIHERIIKDPRPTRPEAQQIADAFLRERAMPFRPIKLETTLFGLRPGIYVPVKIPSEGIDQLMPVVEVTRKTRPGQIDIFITLNQAPVKDNDMVFDLFKRLSRIESKSTSRQERIEQYMDVADDWTWTEDFTLTTHACPFPSDNTFPAEDLFPC